MQDGLHVEDLPDRQDSWSERWAHSTDGAVESCRGRG